MVVVFGAGAEFRRRTDDRFWLIPNGVSKAEIIGSFRERAKGVMIIVVRLIFGVVLPDLTAARRGRAVKRAAIVFSAIACGGVSVSAQTNGKRTFSTSASCALTNFLTAEQCRIGYANALAELDEKSPRFTSRAECEKEFKHCMIIGFDRKRVEFQPALRGFEVNVRSATDMTVLPVIDGDSASLGFRVRTTLRPDAGVSLSQRQQAQERWAQAQKARLDAQTAPTRASEGEINSGIAPYGETAPSITPPAPRQPTAHDLESERRRRQEIRDAPTVY